MSSRRLQDVFSVTIFCLPRRLQDILKTSCKNVLKTFSRRICKMSSRRLGRRKIVTLKTSSRRLEDQQMFAGYWVKMTFSKLRFRKFKKFNSRSVFAELQVKNFLLPRKVWEKSVWGIFLIMFYFWDISF